jgi:hypothetical protein
MTSIRIDAEVIFQVKSRRDPITQSLWRPYAEHFLHRNAPLRTAMAEAGLAGHLHASAGGQR